jgi:hypothetical protein
MRSFNARKLVPISELAGENGCAGGTFVDASRMPFYIHTEADLDHAIAGLIAADPRWRDALAAAGRPSLRRRPDGFAGLAAIVVSQQLSTASAKAIWDRLEIAIDPVSPEAVRRARTAKLARAGLSGPKIRTLKAIARAIERGELDLAALAALPADEAHRRLTAVHGCCSSCGRGLRAATWGRSPKRGGHGGARRRACCGPIIGPPSSATAPPFHPQSRSGEHDGD